MPDHTERPVVGIGVIVLRDEKILLGERLAGHGASTYSLPGGHLEFGESFSKAARREVEEETGLQDLVPRGVIAVSNDIAYEKHYITVGYLLESASGEPIAAEPEKSRKWAWYEPTHLPEPLFVPSQKLIENWLSGKTWSDS